MREVTVGAVRYCLGLIEEAEETMHRIETYQEAAYTVEARRQYQRAQGVRDRELGRLAEMLPEFAKTIEVLQDLQEQAIARLRTRT